MPTTQQISIRLPNDMAAAVKTKVTNGEYASESEVICEGLRALQARDQAMENWLKNVVCPAYDAIKAGKMRLYTIDEVRASIDAIHAKTK